MRAGCVLVVALVIAPAERAAADPKCETQTVTMGDGPLGYRATGEVCDGKRHGPWRFTFLNGAKLREGSYDNGLEHGPWRTFHREGGKQDEGQYVAGKPDGKWIRYAPDGTKIEERSYALGVREGPLLRWTNDGKLAMVRSCSNGACATRCKMTKTKSCTVNGPATPAPPPKAKTPPPKAKRPAAKPPAKDAAVVR